MCCDLFFLYCLTASELLALIVFRFPCNIYVWNSVISKEGQFSISVKLKLKIPMVCYPCSFPVSVLSLPI